MNRHEMTVEELTTELRALRETPAQEFASRLDARAEAGFPRVGDGVGARLLARIRSASPGRKLLPALAGATTVIVVATAVVVSTRGGGTEGDGSAQIVNPAAPTGHGAEALGRGVARERQSAAPSEGQALSAGQPDAILPHPVPAGPGTAPGVRNRKIERSAQLTLATDPDRVQEVGGKVLDVVGRYRGIVLSSSVRDGGEGEAGATFDLLIPSPRMSPALADLSEISEVRSRSENTLDITAPFVSARERLRDARAEAEGLLRQLAEADTDAERASVKAQLRIVRGRIAGFRSQVRSLERRADFSRVSLDVVTGDAVSAVPGPGDGDWTIADAADDAARVLAVAAGIGLVALAVMLPVALIAGAAWAARRTYLRRSREQALGA